MVQEATLKNTPTSPRTDLPPLNHRSLPQPALRGTSSGRKDGPEAAAQPQGSVDFVDKSKQQASKVVYNPAETLSYVK